MSTQVAQKEIWTISNFLRRNLTRLPVFDKIYKRKRGVFVGVDCVYTVREVATVLKVSEKTVYNLIHSQELSCIRVRGQIRITSKQLIEYLKGGTSE